jgi:predicted outer membrane repeat protein
MKRFLNRIYVVFAGILVMIMSPAKAGTITVINKNDSGAGSLRQALLSANAGDTIIFQSGLTGTIVLNGELLINKNLTIIGPGANKLALSGNDTSRVINIDNNTKVGPRTNISGLTFTKGLSNDFLASNQGGAGILNSYGVLTLNDCAFLANVALSGGAILNKGNDGSVTLHATNCGFTNNKASYDGGAIANGGRGGLATVRMTYCSFSGNSAPSGGAIINYGGAGQGILSAYRCDFDSNIAYYGGAIYGSGQDNGRADLNLTDCDVINNSAATSGGGIWQDNAPGGLDKIALTECTVSHNTAGESGGGVALAYVSAIVSNSTFNNNTVTKTDTDSLFIGGGALWSYGQFHLVTVTDSTFYSNVSNGNGGAIANHDSDFIIKSSTFSNNSATHLGGALSSQSQIDTATVTLGNNLFKSGASGPNIYSASGSTIVSEGYNLSSDAAGGDSSATPGGLLNHTGDIRNTEPLLDPMGLKDNGGPTLTIGLQNNSPALDKGNGFGTQRDQRRFHRPFNHPAIPDAIGGDGSDIGAFENQPTPLIDIGDATKIEGNSGLSYLVFPIRLSAPASQDIDLKFATSNRTAIAGSDYQALNGGMVISAGQTESSILVPITGDTFLESDETFVLSLSDATNALLRDAQATGTITNDDSGPSLSINNPRINEGNPAQGAPGTTSLSFTVSLSQTAIQPVTVEYATANGSAVAGSDYTAQSGTLTIPSGQAAGTITISVIGDAIPESNDRFFVNLTNITNAVFSGYQGIGTIINDDAGPGLSINDVTVSEDPAQGAPAGTLNATFTVTLAAASNQTVTVSAISANGTALSPSDYTATGVRLSFAPGETSKTVTVPVKGDLLDEVNETFFVILSSAIHATLARGRGVGTINDNDASPMVSIDNLSIGEGNSGQRVASLRLRLSALSGQSVRVSYATANGTATAGNDYVTVAPTVVAFNAGSSVAYARVLLNGDLLNEPNETFLVNLSSPINATVADGQALGTILNDDTAPALSINDVSITEGNTGTRNLTFTVTLSKASGQSVSVNYATANGSARSSLDYGAKTGTLSFAPGTALTRTISVTINGETLVEGDETLFVLLSGAVNASVGVARGTGTILNDDSSG